MVYQVNIEWIQLCVDSVDDGGDKRLEERSDTIDSSDILSQRLLKCWRHPWIEIGILV
jgi:hypothetical protein